jgi:hypothetical protein
MRRARLAIVEGRYPAFLAEELARWPLSDVTSDGVLA